MLRYFTARARLAHTLRVLASNSKYHGEAALIAHACEYQASSLRTFLHTLSVSICDAAAASPDGRGNAYVNASWITIFRAFYDAALRVPSLGPQAEQLVNSALAFSRPSTQTLAPPVTAFKVTAQAPKFGA